MWFIWSQSNAMSTSTTPSTFTANCASTYSQDTHDKPVSLDSSSTFVDTHCHIDYILQKAKIVPNDTATDGGFSQLAHRFGYTSQLDACINIFCDPLSLSPGFSNADSLLTNNCVYGAFGLHPHHAASYSDSTEARIRDLIRHPKCVAWVFL